MFGLQLCKRGNSTPLDNARPVNRLAMPNPGLLSEKNDPTVGAYGGKELGDVRDGQGVCFHCVRDGVGTERLPGVVGAAANDQAARWECSSHLVD